jgi:hypothetical protein
LFWGVGGAEAMQRYARESEYGENWGWDGEYMLRRGESSLSCMKFKVPSLMARVFLMSVSPSSFLALLVKELCLLFWPNPLTTWCFCAAHFFRIRCPHGIYMFFWDR